MGQIAVVIITKNEASSIADCVDSAVGLGPVWVLDSSSVDGTQEIARTHGASVVNFVWDGRYPKKKQAGVDLVPPEYDWVLSLDADERLTPELVDELTTLVSSANNDLAAVEIPLSYYWRGVRLRHGYTVMKRALVHRARCRFPDVDDVDAPGITEVEGHYQPEPDGRVITASHRMIHNDPDPISRWVDRHNRYSDWEAWLSVRQQLAEEIRGHRSKQGRIFARVPFKPLLFFVYAYLYKRGFLDRRAGLDYALANSFYYWLTSVKRREASERARRDDEPVIVHVAAAVGRAYGGASTNSVELNRALLDTGARVRFITSAYADDSGGIIAADERHNIETRAGKVTWLEPAFPLTLKNGRGLLRTILKQTKGSHLIHLEGQYSIPSVFVYLVSKLRGLPYGIQPHGTLEPYQRSQSEGKKRLWNAVIGNRVLRSATYIMFASDSEAERAADVVRPDQVRVAPLGATEAVDGKMNNPALTERVQRAGKDRTVLFIGRLAEKKRPDILVRAWGELEPEVRDGSLLLIVGPEDVFTQEGLKTIADQVGVGGSIEFWGLANQDEVAWFYQNSGIFVLPSENENFGLTVTEALTYGQFVITTRHVAAASHVTAADAGVILDELSPTEVARALRAALTDRTSARAAGRRGQLYVTAHLSWEPLASALLLEAGHQP